MHSFKKYSTTAWKKDARVNVYEKFASIVWGKKLGYP